MTPTPTARRPTSRVSALIVVVSVLVYLLMLTGNPWLLPIIGAAVGVMVAGLLTGARLDGLVVGLALAPCGALGDELDGLLTISNTGRTRSSETTLRVHNSLFEDLTASVGRLDPGDRVTIRVRLPTTARGATQLSCAHLQSSPSLGLLTVARRQPVEAPSVVHPRLHAVTAVPITSALAGDTEGPVVRAPGLEILGPREWRPGDDRGRIHWRSTARTGRPILLERGQVLVPQLRLALVGLDTSPGFEPALALAASVCDRALRAGQTLTVVAWHVTGPVLGASGSPRELMDWWSTVHDTVLPDPAEFAATALAGFGSGNLLVVGPPEMDGDWIGRAARDCAGLTLHRLVVSE